MAPLSGCGVFHDSGEKKRSVGFAVTCMLGFLPAVHFVAVSVLPVERQQRLQESFDWHLCLASTVTQAMLLHVAVHHVVQPFGRCRDGVCVCVVLEPACQKDPQMQSRFLSHPTDHHSPTQCQHHCMTQPSRAMLIAVRSLYATVLM